MFQITLKYKDHSAPPIVIAQRVTMKQLQEALRGPQPAVITTAGEPIVIDTSGAIAAVIRTVYGNRVKRTQTLYFEETKMADETIDMTPDVAVDDGMADEAIMSDGAVVEPVEDSSAILPPTPYPQEVGVDANFSNPTTSDNKEQARFVSFREKIKGLDVDEDSWEAQIVEKKAAYIEELKEIAAVLDDKLISMKEFKTEQLG